MRGDRAGSRADVIDARDQSSARACPSPRVAALSAVPGVAYAVPDYIAHAAGAWIPNDPGRGRTAEGWEKLQWNLLAAAGVDAPAAWGNLIADHHAGGKGAVVAILDTGVAYRNWHNFRRSPDLGRTRFVSPIDLIANNNYPLDREGHGTFVASEVAESTNNGIGLAGLAYGASIMPVRVLNADGTGDAATIARGIRYAANHGADVINLSLEFSLDVAAADIPDIQAALRYAHSRGVVVVAASGNEGTTQIAYPARFPTVISVGATTLDRCLAEYSNTGPRLDLVAPGGGQDSGALADPDCHPARSLPDIFQMTLYDSSDPRRFGLPGGWFGTSMSAPMVSAVAALVIASGVIGRHPYAGCGAHPAQADRTATRGGGHAEHRLRLRTRRRRGGDRGRGVRSGLPDRLGKPCATSCARSAPNTVRGARPCSAPTRAGSAWRRSCPGCRRRSGPSVALRRRR